jgi:hypothetical protein
MNWPLFNATALGIRGNHPFTFSNSPFGFNVHISSFGTNSLLPSGFSFSIKNSKPSFQTKSPLSITSLSRHFMLSN